MEYNGPVSTKIITLFRKMRILNFFRLCQEIYHFIFMLKVTTKIIEMQSIYSFQTIRREIQRIKIILSIQEKECKGEKKKQK